MTLKGRALVDGVSFKIDPGEKTALLGASGSGKSLTAAALLGQLPAGMNVSGSLRVDGNEVPLSGSRADGGPIAVIGQDPTTALNPMIRLGRQLAIPLQKAGLSAEAARERASDLLASVGLEDPDRILAGFSGELSGGQLQRVCIALALACRNSVLIADEPTTALDVVSQSKVLEVLARTSAYMGAMLFITHDLAAAAVLCGQALVLKSGRIVEEGPMDTILARPEHPYTQQLVEAAYAGFEAFGLEAGT